MSDLIDWILTTDNASNLISAIALVLAVVSIVVSVVSIGVAIKSWSRSRSIYGIEAQVLRQVTGGRDDKGRVEALNQKLKKGEYQIVGTYPRTADGDTEIILARIKKPKGKTNE